MNELRKLFDDRYWVGFDDLFNSSFMNNPGVNSNYPPYNLVDVDGTHYVIEVAVAGFNENEIDIELKDHTLSIKGSSDKGDTKEGANYIYKGVSTKDFVRVFKLNDNMNVVGAEFKNGMLRVNLEKVIPEHMKPRKIPILGSQIENDGTHFENDTRKVLLEE